MYHFCLQEVNQPAQFSELWLECESKVLLSFTLAEHAVSISTFLDTQEFFQEAKMKDVCTGGY
jgi:hypothetical protein